MNIYLEVKRVVLKPCEEPVLARENYSLKVVLVNDEASFGANWVYALLFMPTALGGDVANVLATRASVVCMIINPYINE